MEDNIYILYEYIDSDYEGAKAYIYVHNSLDIIKQKQREWVLDLIDIYDIKTSDDILSNKQYNELLEIVNDNDKCLTYITDIIDAKKSINEIYGLHAS